MFPNAKKVTPRPEFEQVQQPRQRLTDVCDTITETCVSWFTEVDPDPVSADLDPQEEEEDKFGGGREPATLFAKGMDTPSQYKIQLTREVEHNFQQISKGKMTTMEEVLLRQVVLPGDGPISKKTLILDLDDTLVHTINPAFNYAALGVVHTNVRTTLYQDPSFEVFSINFVIRPYAIQLLKEMSQLYEIVVLFLAEEKAK